MKIAPAILAVLSEADCDGNVLRLAGTLDRATYVAANKVLEAAGGKWDRRAKAHVFDGDAAEAIEPIVLTGEYSRTKQDFGQFDTPADLADRIVDLANIQRDQKVYEPSCGTGAIVAALRLQSFGIGGFHYFANEIDPKRFEFAKSNYFPSGGITNKDFMSIDPAPVFDRVVMNPPFAKQADIEHVLHAVKFLRPGGRLVSITSASVTFRENSRTQEFRAMVARRGGTIELLPEGSFMASGTGVNTCLVAFNV